MPFLNSVSSTYRTGVMAERVVVVEKSVEDLEKEITCAICQEHYTEPKVLSCLHYYCKQCVYRLALRTGLDKPFSCPECRKDTSLPQGGVDNLPTAFFVNRLKELHSKMERALGKVDAKCELCSGDKAEAFCRQCAQFICEECIKAHQRMKKSFPGHKVVTFDELKKGGAKEIVTQESPLQTCTKHDQPMNIYCFDCSCLICLHCTVKDHSGHNYEFIRVSAPEMKKKLIQQLEPLKEVHANLSLAVEEIQTTKSEIEAQGDSVANEIVNSFEELHTIIENRKQELLKEAATNVTQKLERLSVQAKSLSTDRVVVQSVIEYTEQSIEHLAEDEIMCMHAELESRIDQEVKEHRKEGRSLDPVEEVDVGVEVSCTEDLKQLCQIKAKITRLPIDPEQCVLSGEGVKMAEINKATTSNLFLKTKLTNGRDTKRKCTITCHLKSLVDGSIVKCNLIHGNEYHIQYTPTLRGRHELIVSVNGQEVAGSPFPVFVSIPPTQLGKPVRVINTGGYKKPIDMVINSVGEMVVLGSNQIDVFDKEGTRLKSISASDYNIRHPHGVAIDSTDCVYLAHISEHRIVKLSKDMKLLKTYSSKQSCYLRGMAVVGDEVMVCDCKNDCIHVYTTELDYVRQIGSHGKDPGKFDGIRDISSDEHSNLYVSDSDNSRIQVLSNGGEFLRSFGCDENGVNKLNVPRGVCVAGQYVYVVNWSNHNVSVFTTEGAYVTSFGQKGSSKGDFKYPWGVCVDGDGFVYVCDNDNVRIQVF